MPQRRYPLRSLAPAPDGLVARSPANQQPYRQIPPSAINSPEHQTLALAAAADGLVMLKNEAAEGGSATLPLSQAKVKSVAVIGPNSNCSQQVRPHGPTGDHHCNQL